MLLALNIFSILAYYFLSTSNYTNDTLPEVFVLFTLLYNNIIPISLFVAMDIVRVLQVLYIQTIMKKAVDFKTGDINEDLGQIEYMLIDKNGTITENEYSLHTCIVDNDLFVRKDTERSLSSADEEKPFFNVHEAKDSTFQMIEKVGPVSPRSLNDTLHMLRISETSTNLKVLFLKCLALCNSVEPCGNKLLGPSGEEKALVIGAEELGVKLITKTSDFCEIDIHGKREEYSIIDFKQSQLESQKTRIIIRQKENEEAILFVRGRSESIMSNIKSGSAKAEISSEVKRLAIEGLKTQVLAMKFLNSHELNEFISKIEVAKSSPLNVDGKIENAYTRLEESLEYLGIAGVEDKILPETIECIDLLQSAGIKLIIVSGDNESSILSAAYGAKLIPSDLSVASLRNMEADYACSKSLHRIIASRVYHDMTVFGSKPITIPLEASEASPLKEAYSFKRDDSIVSEYLEEASIIRSKIRSKSRKLSYHPFVNLENKGPINDTFLSKPFYPNSIKFALSIDRTTFRTALNNQESRKLLVCCLVTCQTACFSDMLPQDKADLCRLIKENISFRPMVLAVGSGNSDIAMIQEADVGIGIKGNGDSYAKNFCEIAINHFALLKDLILVHGH